MLALEPSPFCLNFKSHYLSHVTKNKGRNLMNSKIVYMSMQAEWRPLNEDLDSLAFFFAAAARLLSLSLLQSLAPLLKSRLQLLFLLIKTGGRRRYCHTKLNEPARVRYNRQKISTSNSLLKCFTNLTLQNNFLKEKLAKLRNLFTFNEI